MSSNASASSSELVNVKAFAQSRRRELERKLDVMETYLDEKRTERDWHGVQDAASDIRELETEIACLETILTYP